MRIFQSLILLSFLFFIFTLTFTSSIDFNQDLGRHLKLGEIITTTKNIPNNNLFSYTNPDFPFINHHWLPELIFYHLSKLIGLNALLYIKTLLIIASIFIVTILTIRRTGFNLAIIMALVFSPFILERADIRPEIFGYFFFSLILFVLLNYPKNKLLIYFIPIIMLFWVNTHISFIFGVLLVFLLIAKVYFQNKDFKALIVLSAGLFLLFFNPHNIKGVFYPFFIFNNYGYTIVENQNLFFLNQMTFNPLIKYYFFISPLVVFSLIILTLKRRFLSSLLLGIYFFLALSQIRHLPFFVLIAIPTISQSIKLLLTSKKLKPILSHRLQLLKSEQIANLIHIFLFVLILFLIILNLDSVYFKTFDIQKHFGTGFSEDGKDAVIFIKQNHLTGNVFNNFDIGGYLIYKLYPEYSFFVDNRPEAYPKEFIQSIYIRLQEDKKIRDEVFKKYKINTIIFAHTDQTPWARTFLESIYKDLKWKIVYIDSAMLILVNNTNLPDLRNQTKYMQDLINQESNYLRLLRLMQVFSLLGKIDVAKEAFLKAKSINPDSCAIKKISYYQSQNILNPDLSEELKKQAWYCF